ncbi:type II secretion system minor pseudopilin GspK [Thioalkalivibrio sulfidiphilus]|uniref:type II secretion system minor pseudopilin GspK n=1 Tax=Thioalkalivibrio sulfidiphilus TaxID=1033854 RepID=UPI0004781EC4|nr:type II secretion system minor pseudopilin GspK [Thioalkalivibrio sulfidiphilus]
MRTAPRRQRGVALITALLVVVLATLAAVAMVARQHLDIRRAGNMLGQDQAYLIALAAEGYALRLLSSDDRDLPWEGCISPPLWVTLEEAQMEIWLEDMHCRFNLNNLAARDDAAANGFIRLLEGVRSRTPDLSLDPEGLTAAVRDWMNPETDDPYYRLATPPYLSANRPMIVAAELRRVQGMNNELWQALSPYVTALPATGTTMNLEFAEEVLQDAFPDRGEVVASRFFRLGVHAELGGRRFLLCSLLDTGNISVVWRSQSMCED